MAQAEPSAQELILRRTRAGFVGREAERAAFLGNFDIPPGDPRHRFRFHVHGSAGIGKTSLVQELAHLARERGALTAQVDDGVGSVPEAMETLCHEFSAQGRRLKDLERRLATWRERRREAEAAERLAASSLPELDDTRVEVHRRHGRWAQARALAERLRERDPAIGTFHLAMTVHRSKGPEAAEPLWRDLARLVEQDTGMEPVMRAQAHCFLGCALADGPRAERGLSELLALTPEWDDLATLADILTELRTAPATNRPAHLTTCLTAVTEARDAVQARWSARS